MKYVLRAWGELKRGFEVLALGEIIYSGHGGSLNGGLWCWHWVKYVLRAWGQFKRGFEVLALCQICFGCMGAVETGV